MKPCKTGVRPRLADFRPAEMGLVVRDASGTSVRSLDVERSAESRCRGEGPNRVPVQPGYSV
jgi:hypothetical protein